MKYPIEKYTKKCIGMNTINKLRDLNGKKWMPCVGCEKLVKLERNDVGHIINMECDNNGMVIIAGYPDESAQQTGELYGSDEETMFLPIMIPTEKESRILDYLNNVSVVVTGHVKHIARVKILICLREGDGGWELEGMRTDNIETYIIMFSRKSVNIGTPQQYNSTMRYLTGVVVDETVNILTGRMKTRIPSLHNNRLYRIYLVIKLIPIIPRYPKFKDVE